ncbi:MAG: chloride channel protein [Paludibacteraceae bacterium]|jgi:CIC family chloride channel protein|nr:chloride channel protein [Paludibacteraceae bacterium]HPG55568.1 chloride channel protein [Candidatus Enterocola sp.]
MISNWYTKLLNWREKKIPTQRFVILLSFFVGIFTALSACLLKAGIHGIQKLLTLNFNINSENFLYLLYPVIGILLSALFVKYIVKDDISHGVTRILYAISQRKSILKSHNMWTSVVASSMTIGFGGSVGAEAPVVLTGSAIGSNLGRFFKMDQKTLMLMVGCGAAGAISGIFKAPIAGVVFTIEVLMLDMTFTSIVPLLISSVTATAVSYFLMGDAVMFSMQGEAFVLNRIPAYLMLGVVCGFASLYFTRGMNWLEDFFRKLKNFWSKLVIGGLILSALIFLLPPLYGEGYDSISALLNNNTNGLFDNSLFYNFKDNQYWLLFYMSLIIIFKIFASAATNAAGGCGGIFAPSLFVGCFVGFIVAIVLQLIGVPVPAQNFALAGMAGLMSGVMHAPLTGIFLIAELSGGYSLFMPLMIVSVVSYCTIILFEPHSLYAMRLAKKGELITHHKDKAVLSLLKTENVIETDLQVIRPEAMFGDLIKLISKSKRNIFPVVDESGVFLGVVTLEEIRNIMFRSELYNRFNVQKLMVSPPATVSIDESMDAVMKKFEQTHAWNLPVLDGDKYVGYVSKSKIFSAYRDVLVEFSSD